MITAPRKKAAQLRDKDAYLQLRTYNLGNTRQDRGNVAEKDSRVEKGE